MATSAQIRQQIADLVAKRAMIDRDISITEGRKASKDAEAVVKAAQATRASSPTMVRSYLRQAETARNVAIAEGKKIAALAKKRSGVSQDESRRNRELNDALRREQEAERRMENKAEQARAQETRRHENQRRSDERQRQHELQRADALRRSDQAATRTRIEATEGRLASQIAALGEPKQERLRVLYATATPEGDLRVSQEIRRVKNAVASSLHRDLIDIEHAPDVTVDDLFNYLTSFRPHVVHFSGHANEDVMVLDDGSIEGGQGVEVPIELFMRAVSSVDRAPLLVVLNACSSATNLESLLAAVPLAIGMTASVGDADAITFATRFYRAVADGQSVDSALTMARVGMEMNGLADHDLPTLVTGPGIDASAVSLVLSRPGV